MHVFCVFVGYAYEGSTLTGIFQSFSSARAHAMEKVGQEMTGEEQIEETEDSFCAREGGGYVKVVKKEVLP